MTRSGQGCHHRRCHHRRCHHPRPPPPHPSSLPSPGAQYRWPACVLIQSSLCPSNWQTDQGFGVGCIEVILSDRWLVGKLLKKSIRSTFLRTSLTWKFDECSPRVFVRVTVHCCFQEKSQCLRLSCTCLLKLDQILSEFEEFRRLSKRFYQMPPH